MLYQSRANGFTLIELIMVIVVLGALSLFVAPRFNSKTSFDTLSFHQELKTAIRFAHKLSIASGCAVQVTLSANSYALFYPDTTCNPPDAFGTNPVSHPVQSGAYAGSSPSGVSITSFGNFFFTASGAPSNSGTITLNPGGRQIVVNPLTGFVQ
ncbi:MAG: GspH/FimT family pseudopilin [Gammaproteobacteria bacterium]|nr:GspH/FimT family pseudopilin [Gammaproteobacteria bacterium]